MAIIHSRERGKLRDIERAIGKTFEYRQVPTPEHIIEKQLYYLANRIERVEVPDDEIAQYVPGVIKKLGWLSSEDLVKRVMALEFKRLLEYYKDAPQIDYIDAKPAREGKKPKGEPRSDAEKDRRTAERGMARLYISVGKRDGFFAGNLIDMLNTLVPGQRVDVGRIDLLPGYSLFDVRKADARRVVGSLKGAEFMGKRIYCEIAEEGKDYARLSNRRSADSAPADDEVRHFPARKSRRPKRRK